MGILLWIVLGGIAGWLASTITRSHNTLLWDVLLGIVGAVVGGFVMNLFGQPSVTGFNTYSILVALIGSVITIGVGRRLKVGYR